MRLDVSLACVVVAAVAGGGKAGVTSAAALPSRAERAPAVHKIAIDLRGPLAMVQVTRSLPPAEQPAGAGGDSRTDRLDLALPARAALLEVEIGQGGRWRSIPRAPAARRGFLDAIEARGLASDGARARPPFDDDTSFRVSVVRGGVSGAASAPMLVRYRFSALVESAHGRQRLRFPATPELSPPPAEVSVTAAGLADLDIAGVRSSFGRAGADGGGPRVTVSGRASGRSGWEISYALPAAAAVRAGPSLQGSAAVAALSDRESAIAFAVQAAGAGAGAGERAGARAENILFVVDRSRSVGPAGLSAEHQVAMRVLDLYPPATHFDVLFFDRAVKRLFPMSRPATREAMEAIDAEMVPDRLANGTDLAGALRGAGELLRREASAFAPRTLLVVITDGAIPEVQTGPLLDGALGAVPGIDLQVALLVVRANDDQGGAPAARQALQALAGARGGVERELGAGEINDGVAALLDALEGGGDVFSPRLASGGASARLADALAPGEGVTGVVRVAGRLPREGEIIGATHGHPVRAPLRLVKVDAAWLRPHAGVEDAPGEGRLLSAAELVALVEPVYPATVAAPPAAPAGSVDRGVVRNTLSLAFMPRARACYQSRPGSTPAARDLAGRVRMAIDLTRGEVVDARIESSTLQSPLIESCLRESAFALDVPRAYRNDQVVTAVVNLVFRPRTPEKRHTAEETFPIGSEIDMILEELHKSEAAQRPEDAEKTAQKPAAASPAPPPVD